MTQHKSIDRGAVVTMVLTGLRDVLASNDMELPPDLGEETSLVGRQAVLDSIGLVTLVVDLEQRVESEHGVVIALANDRAMSMRNSPFRTVASLTDYVCTLLAEEHGA
jgi:acyl carrier protein